jgi:hypothetical protein
MMMQSLSRSDAKLRATFTSQEGRARGSVQTSELRPSIPSPRASTTFPSRPRTGVREPKNRVVEISAEVPPEVASGSSVC